MNIIAEKLGMDPVELRLKNLLKEGDVNVIGEEMISVGNRECLEKVAKAIEWGKPSEQPVRGPWRRGKGIAVANKYSLGPTASSAVVRVLPDGVVEVRTQATELGQGCHTILAQIAAEELKVPVEKVRMVTCDTQTTPFGPGAWSSRQTYSDGNAVRLASMDAKRELLRLAAKKLDSTPESLDYEDGRILVKGTTRSIPLIDLYTDHLWNTKFLEDVGEIIGRATFHQRIVPMDDDGHSPRSCSFYIHNAQAVEAEVNVETGQARVLKYASAADCGRAINPVNVQQQIEGGMSMGIGTTLLEEMVIKDGKVVNTDYLDYKLPTSLDHPTVGNMIPIVVEAPHREGPYGAKGVGEGTLIAAAPAISGAIYNAVGVRVHELPITAEKIFMALKAGRR
jgi:carbon-monoxide dehydrogenase large subunit